MIKPDGVQRGLIGKIIFRFKNFSKIKKEVNFD
jgi:Nucleoside diphosphate kinase.